MSLPTQNPSNRANGATHDVSLSLLERRAIQSQPLLSRGIWKHFWFRAVAYVGFWTVLGLLNAFNNILQPRIKGDQFSWTQAVVIGLVDWYLWALLTPFVWDFARRFSFESMPRGRAFLAHLMASIGCAFLVTIVTMQVMEFVDFNSRLFPFSHRLGIFLFGPAICYLWIYWAAVGACHAMQYYRRVRSHEIATSRLEAQLTQSQLMMLKMQLQPHFLFNTLNAISSLVYEDPGTAERMIIRLSDLLRITLEKSGAHEVRLREEMHFLQRYLDIQQIRFGDSLDVEIDVSREIQDALVPNMILQPFVENSFCHGLGIRPGQGKLEIRGIRKANMVEIEVRDNGPGIPDAPIKDGIGLSNVRSRLRQLYGDSYKLVLANSPLGGAVVQIGFPFRVLAEDMKLREAIANG